MNCFDCSESFGFFSGLLVAVVVVVVVVSVVTDAVAL